MSEAVKLPQAISTATLRIMGVDLIVLVLDDGQRVIEAESLERFFAVLGSGATMTEDEAAALAKFCRGG